MYCVHLKKKTTVLYNHHIQNKGVFFLILKRMLIRFYIIVHLRVYPLLSIKSMFRFHHLFGIVYCIKRTFCVTWPAHFLEDPIGVQAALLCRDLHRWWEIILIPRLGVLQFLFFIISYICRTHPYIINITHHARALKSKRILCLALWFLIDGSYFLYSISSILLIILI